jgi:hypothetical protein
MSPEISLYRPELVETIQRQDIWSQDIYHPKPARVYTFLILIAVAAKFHGYSSTPIDLVIHPRDLNLVFIAYEGKTHVEPLTIVTQSILHLQVVSFYRTS